MKFNHNFCTSLQSRALTIQTLSGLVKYSSGYSFELISSSFKRTRAILRYVLGRTRFGGDGVTASPNAFSRYAISSQKVPSVSYVSRFALRSRLYPHRQDTEKRFRLAKRWANTGVTLGFVGVCMRNENGYPLLIPEKKTIDLSRFLESIGEQVFDLSTIRDDVNSVDLIKFEDAISIGCQGAVYKAQIPSKYGDAVEDVAVKMCFNYSIESNAMAIINATIKECIPYNGDFSSDVIVPSRRKLPPHPNIVKILSVFADQFQPLKECDKLYQAALPRRLGGFGRNMTLFIVEKAYDMSLKGYLQTHTPTFEQSFAMLTQCFEAIDYLARNGIAHRDLKPDNILVDVNTNAAAADFPWVVIADFGLCSTQLRLPYQSMEVCKGGNAALMAPEIKTALPGAFATLDYSKADLWAMGTIAYELFNGRNPFYNRKLDSAKFDDSQLPSFPADCNVLSQLIYRILSRNPHDVSISRCSGFTSL